MTKVAARHAAAAFVVAAAAQAIGFPLISRPFGLWERLQAPSWVVIVLVSAIVAFAAASAPRAK